MTIAEQLVVIRLRFSSITTDESIVLGPAPWFRVAGNFVRQGPHGAIVGTFRKHSWEVQAQHFARYICEDPLLIDFEDAEGALGERCGPYSQLSVLDGTVVANDTVVGKFQDQTQLWHCHATDTYWPVMVLRGV